MKNHLRKRFWFELIPGIIVGIVGIVALLNREYLGFFILFFNADLILEMETLAWVVVGVFFVVAIVLLGLATYEWRRSRITLAKADQQTDNEKTSS